MALIKKHQAYLTIVFICLILGLARWAVLDRKFPLFSKPQIILDDFIIYQDFKQIISDESFPVIDARDFESYTEGFIGNAYNVDLDLLYDQDEETLSRIEYIINKYGYGDNKLQISGDSYNVKDVKSNDKTIIVYCWSPTCDRAEELVSILLDTSDYYGQFGKYFNQSNFSIYKGGWEEWDSIENK